MSKKDISVINVIFSGLKVYLYNLDVYLKYLSFPILGSIAGIFLIFLTNYVYMVNLDNIRTSNPIFENTAVILSLLLIITVPAFLIMIKAFVDYVIAFGAVNSMCLIGTKRIKDIYIHKEVIKRRFAPYCILIIVLSIIYGVLSFPILLPVLIIATIFLSLAVQVFTLEEDSSPYIAIRKSINIVKNNFWLITFSLLLIFIISYIVIPYLISWAIGKTVLMDYLIYPIEKYLELLPIQDINYILSEAKISFIFDPVLFAEKIVYATIFTIVIMYMLPFRSACCVYLYKNLGGTPKEEKSPKKETKEK